MPTYISKNFATGANLCTLIRPEFGKILDSRDQISTLRVLDLSWY